MSAGKTEVIPERPAIGAKRQDTTEPPEQAQRVFPEDPDDEVELAGFGSFPASDPPSWTGTIIG